MHRYAYFLELSTTTRLLRQSGWFSENNLFRREPNFIFKKNAKAQVNGKIIVFMCRGIIGILDNQKSRRGS